ncbi:MAG: hypothetical protein WA803_00200 [Steroidobacteraceae bacterium]
MLQSVAAVGVAVAAAVLIAAAPAWADDSDGRPDYLRALSDLRDARAQLDHFGSEPVDHDAEQAIYDIDRAINEIRSVAVMDGIDVQDHVPADAHLVRNGRFHKAMELLDTARRHVSGEEDQPDAKVVQLRAIRHIEEARREVARAMAVVRENG